MASEEPKLSYNAAAYRIRVSFTVGRVFEGPPPIEDLLQRAKTKLEAERSAKKIVLIEYYSDDLLNLWNQIATQGATTLPSEASLSVTLAGGAPALAGLKIGRGKVPGALVSMSLEARSEVAQGWRPEWLEMHIVNALLRSGNKARPNPLQLELAIRRAAAGDLVRDAQIAAAAPLGPVFRDTKAYAILANKGRREVTVAIRSAMPLKEDTIVQEILAQVTKTTEKLKAVAPGNYQVLKDDLTQRLKELATSPLGLGLGEPVSVLGAFASDARPVAANTGAAGAAGTSAAGSGSPSTPAFKPDWNYPGARLLTFVISDDEMEAAIGGFDITHYDDEELKLNDTWLRNEIRNNGIHYGVKDGHIAKILDAISKKEALDRLPVAEGNKGKGPSGAHLYPCYKDARPVDDTSAQVFDIRDMQQRQIVTGGQLVAEVRYKKPPEPGKTVTGREVPPPAPEELPIRVGEGIEVKEAGKYYAMYDGTPLMDHESVAITKDLVHRGDVNLTTGNIVFSGPVIIEGSIDSGAVVEVSGDLHVKGGIRSAFVKCGGALKVEGSIVMGGKGRISVRGDLEANFVEHAIIVCGGSVRVTKNILASEVIAGSHIEVLGDESVISGGMLSCREYLKTTNLGMLRGATTTLNVGVDWRSELTVQIRHKRLESLKRTNENDRNELRELVRKNKAQMTKRHEERKEELQNRLVKIKPLIEKATDHLTKAKSMVSYDPDARIYVRGVATTNCALSVGGKPIRIENNVGGIVLSARRVGGSNIIPIDEFEKKEREAS